MKSIWHSLAWKEWHEHKWKLAAIVTIMWSLAACVAIAVFQERQMLVDAFHFSIILGGLPLTVFIGLGAAAGERSRGTLRFLQALPVPMWRVALHKLGFGLVSVIVPIFLTLLLTTILRLCLELIGFGAIAALPREESPFSGNWVIDITILATIVAASLFIWAAALGVNRKDEISAGAIALAVMVGWWLVLIVVWGVLLMGSFSAETARLRAVGVASAPLGFLMLADIAARDTVGLLLGIGAAVLAHGFLVARYVGRFGGTAESEIRSPKTATRAMNRWEWLAPPRRFALTAIAWKQLRESGPIVLTGLAGSAAIVACWGIAERFYGSEWINFTPLGMIYARVAIVFGFFVALVVGIGVSLNDIGSRLNTFWRSRPIQPDLWFWCKFATGLAVVLASIYVPIGLIAALGDTSLDDGVNYPNAIGIPSGQLAVFAAAVATTCLVRHAVYAAILSLPVVYLGVFSLQMALVMARKFGWMERPVSGDLWQISDLQVAAGLAISFLVSTLIAWLAVRYDWGRKSRF